MKLGPYDIKPILIYLPDTEHWRNRWEKGKKHFAEIGIEGIHHMAGVHGQQWGLATTHIYLVDNRPEEKFNIGPGRVAGNLSQYMTWLVMEAMPFTHFLSLEDDARFVPDWKPRLEQALKDVPPDFDFLFVGSCCAGGGVHYKGEVYEHKTSYPMCGHALIIAKKCVPYLIASNRDSRNPADITLLVNSFPHLRVFSILPRLADQEDTALKP
jgi:hypothetical protein